MMCGAVASGFLLALLPVFIFSFFSQNMLFSGVILATNLSLQESIPAAKKKSISDAVSLGHFAPGEVWDRTVISFSVGPGCSQLTARPSPLSILPLNQLAWPNLFGVSQHHRSESRRIKRSNRPRWQILPYTETTSTFIVVLFEVDANMDNQRQL